jgi:hypothetical protein
MSGKKCGPHVELSSNDAARVTRCTCGTIHVHFHANGLTVRFAPEQFRHVANALGAGQRLIDLADKAGEASAETVN